MHSNVYVGCRAVIPRNNTVPEVQNLGQYWPYLCSLHFSFPLSDNANRFRSLFHLTERPDNFAAPRTSPWAVNLLCLAYLQLVL